MKKIGLVFALIEGLLFLAGAVHVCVEIAVILNDPYTSFPAEAAFVFFIPYAIAMAVVGIVWLAVFCIVKYKRNGEKK